MAAGRCPEVQGVGKWHGTPGCRRLGIRRGSPTVGCHNTQFPAVQVNLTLCQGRELRLAQADQHSDGDRGEVGFWCSTGK